MLFPEPLLQLALEQLPGGADFVKQWVEGCLYGDYIERHPGLASSEDPLLREQRDGQADGHGDQQDSFMASAHTLGHLKADQCENDQLRDGHRAIGSQDQ